MIAVAPCNIISVLNKTYSRVIAILSLKYLVVRPFKANRRIFNLPINSVPASAHKNIHADGFAVAAEYPGIPSLKGHYRAVEYAVGNPVSISPDNGIFAVAP